MAGDRRGEALPLAHDQPHRKAVGIEERKSFGRDMLEGGLDLLFRLGQCEPGLQPVELRTGFALVAGRTLRMRDPAAGGHQVDRSGLDPLDRAQAVAMVDRAFEQIGDGGEVDVRVRSDVDAFACRKPCGPHLVEEDERPDHRPLLVGERPVHLEPAEVMRDRRERLEDGAVVHAS